jgi:competence protein ComEC
VRAVRAPASLLAIPLTVGCATGLACGERAPYLFAVYTAAAALLALLAAVAALASGPEFAPESTVCIIVGALLVGVSAGTDASARAHHSPLHGWVTANQSAARPVVVRGRLRDDAALTVNGVLLTLDLREIQPCDTAGRGSTARGPCDMGGMGSTRGGARLSVIGTLAASAMGEWRAGREVRVTASLREPTVYWNPGVPDERRALERRGVALVGSVKSAAMVEVVANASAPGEWASAFRAWVRSVLAETVAPWSDRSAGVAAAIAIGDRTGLAEDDEERLQAAGTYHVIAISGGNIAILTLLMLGAGRALGIPARFGAATAIVVLLAYGQVTGRAPSVDRAIGAAVLFLAGRLLELRGPSINILAVTAVLGVSLSPTAVFDPGFLLSFGATLGILIGVPRLTIVFSRVVVFPAVVSGFSRVLNGPPKGGHYARRRQPRQSPYVVSGFSRTQDKARTALSGLAASALAVVAATIAAEIVLTPIAASLFGRVTCAGLLLNLAAIPLMTIVQAASLATLGAWHLGIDFARACGYIVHTAARGLVDSARLVDFAPWLTREVAPPAWSLVAGYYGALLLSLLSPRASRGAATAAALFGTVIVVAPQWATRDGVPPPPPGWLRIVFLDVGQGDATLVVFPDRRALLVDAGGLPAAPLQDPKDGPAFDLGERVVSRTLRAFGVRSLDTFVLTHADPDHIGGARSVLRSFRPRAIWEGVAVPPHDPLRWLSEAADDIGAEWRTARADDRLRLSGVDIHTLHPPQPDWERQRVRNDDSIVLAVRMGNVSVILPGDVGREGESRVLDHLQPTPLMVLKAPHHGSATSSTAEFLERVRPAAVIFSAGRNNRFGHPAPLVVARYRAMGTTMFSTAEDGAVILDTNGERVAMRTWRGRTVNFAEPARPASQPH